MKINGVKKVPGVRGCVLETKVKGNENQGSGVIWCGTAILAVTVHGRDARATSK